MEKNCDFILIILFVILLKNTMIQIESKSILKAVNQIKQQYSHISDDMLNQAISRALNHTAQKSRTEGNKNIRKIYNIGASRINNELKVGYSNAKSLTASVKASGSPLSWNNFQAKQENSSSTTSFNRKGIASSRLNRKAHNNAKKGVSAKIKNSEGVVNLPTAFIQVANGGITVFARGKYKAKGQGIEFGKARLPIVKITTISIPLMFANKEVISPTSLKSGEILMGRISHEIKYLLSK